MQKTSTDSDAMDDAIGRCCVVGRGDGGGTTTTTTTTGRTTTHARTSVAPREAVM